jgi:hypothetical protein
LNTENLKLMFDPVSVHRTSEQLRIAYEASVGDVIALDVAVIVASGNIQVSPSFLQPTVTDTSYGGND